MALGEFEPPRKQLTSQSRDWPFLAIINIDAVVGRDAMRMPALGDEGEGEGELVREPHRGGVIGVRLCIIKSGDDTDVCNARLPALIEAVNLLGAKLGERVNRTALVGRENVLVGGELNGLLPIRSSRIGDGGPTGSRYSRGGFMCCVGLGGGGELLL